MASLCGEEVGSYCLEGKTTCLFFCTDSVIDIYLVKPCAQLAFSFDICDFSLDQKSGLCA